MVETERMNARRIVDAIFFFDVVLDRRRPKPKMELNGVGLLRSKEEKNVSPRNTCLMPK